MNYGHYVDDQVDDDSVPDLDIKKSPKNTRKHKRGMDDDEDEWIPNDLRVSKNGT
jgi:hypothetical protein